ncbi:MAG: universal stress protein [Candidatus Manganitrophus sp. SB1]|nr:universal stress protein [Candidatus Manganitrophus morganii]
MTRIEQILVPTDFSSYATEALKEAVYLAQNLKAKITLLHVFESLFPYTPPPSRGPHAGAYQWLQNLKREQEEELRVAAEIVRKEGVQVAPLFKEGLAHVEIIRTAQEIKTDLIALGTHGKKGLTHLLLGSVTERVTREAPCPVLIVREKKG